MDTGVVGHRTVPWTQQLWDSGQSLDTAVMGQSLLLYPAGTNGVDIRKRAVGMGTHLLRLSWPFNPCLEVLAAGVLVARIHPKDKIVLMWMKTRPSKSIHSIPHVCWWEVPYGEEGCLQGPGPGVVVSLGMLSPLERGWSSCT